MSNDTRNLALVIIAAILSISASVWLWEQVGGNQRSVSSDSMLSSSPASSGDARPLRSTTSQTSQDNGTATSPVTAGAQNEQAEAGTTGEPCVGHWLYLGRGAKLEQSMSVLVTKGHMEAQWLDYLQLEYSYKPTGSTRITGFANDGSSLTLDCSKPLAAQVTIYTAVNQKLDIAARTEAYTVKRQKRGDVFDAAVAAGWVIGD